MKIAEIQINPWENWLKFIVQDLEINLNDYVIVETNQTLEIGKVIEINDIEEKNLKTLAGEQGEIKPILRKATLKDLEILETNEKGKEEALEVCKNLIIKHKLPMKLVDVYFSFDNKRLLFAFIADGRVDFRPLVKDLTKQFQKNIRLQQLGVRDEAKINGDIGACGITQCCKTHLKVLGNVSAEQAELQQISNRGADRLSGICNRLKCCLRYENDLYKELSAGFPALGSIVKTPGGKGRVTEWHVLKQAVNVRLEGDEGSVVEVPLDKIN